MAIPLFDAVRISIPCGPPTDILQNVVYALPAKRVRVHSLAAVEISVDGSAWDALTGGETVGADAGSTFLRCPTGNTTVVLRST
jgi:hypothetical protein